MFKCCVCNSASKKANAERSKAEDDTPVGSPRLIAVSAKVDDEIKSATKVEKVNGNVQKSEKTSLLEDASLENKDALLEDKNASLEDKNASLEDKDVSPEDKNASLEDKKTAVVDKNASLEGKNASLENENVSLKDKDASLEDKDVSLEDKNALSENKNVLLQAKDASPEDKDASLGDKDASPEDKNASLEDKDASLEDKDASLEDKNALLEDEDASLENKNASPEEKDMLLDFTLVRVDSAIPCEIPQNGNIDVEESSSSTSTKETVEEAGEETSDRIVDDKDSNVDGVAEDWMVPTEVVPIGAVGPVKINLYDASGYIERTIDDGPEDEGDDSVFEAENEIIAKKASPVSSIPRSLSEEDDGEYVSGGCSGMQEPPATPVARDELALRRHRFFSDLLQAAQNSTEHRVRFDPLGPMVHPG